MIVQNDLQDLVNAAAIAGYPVNVINLQLLTWTAGLATHNPQALPAGFSAVYIFEHGLNNYLKVGMASGAHANPRYQSQHYYLRAPSTLAKSIMNDPAYAPLVGALTPRDWIRTNTSRYNILVPNLYQEHFVSFAESFFILKCNPRYEW